MTKVTNEIEKPVIDLNEWFITKRYVRLGYDLLTGFGLVFESDLPNSCWESCVKK